MSASPPPPQLQFPPSDTPSLQNFLTPIYASIDDRSYVSALSLLSGVGMKVSKSDKVHFAHPLTMALKAHCLRCNNNDVDAKSMLLLLAGDGTTLTQYYAYLATDATTLHTLNLTLQKYNSFSKATLHLFNFIVTRLPHRLDCLEELAKMYISREDYAECSKVCNLVYSKNKDSDKGMLILSWICVLQMLVFDDHVSGVKVSEDKLIRMFPVLCKKFMRIQMKHIQAVQKREPSGEDWCLFLDTLTYVKPEWESEGDERKRVEEAVECLLNEVTTSGSTDKSTPSIEVDKQTYEIKDETTIKSTSGSVVQMTPQTRLLLLSSLYIKRLQKYEEGFSCLVEVLKMVGGGREEDWGVWEGVWSCFFHDQAANEEDSVDTKEGLNKIENLCAEIITQYEVDVARKYKLRGARIMQIKCAVQRGDDGIVLTLIKDYVTMFHALACCFDDIKSSVESIMSNGLKADLVSNLLVFFQDLNTSTRSTLQTDKKILRSYILSIQAISYISPSSLDLDKDVLDVWKEALTAFPAAAAAADADAVGSETENRVGDELVLVHVELTLTLSSLKLSSLKLTSNQTDQKKMYTLIQLTALLEKARVTSPTNYRFKLLLIKLRTLLPSAPSLPALFSEDLQIKEIMLDSMSYTVLPFLQTSCLYDESSKLSSSITNFHLNSKNTVPKYAFKCLQYGNYAQFKDMTCFQRFKMDQSLQLLEAICVSLETSAVCSSKLGEVGGICGLEGDGDRAKRFMADLEEHESYGDCGDVKWLCEMKVDEFCVEEIERKFSDNRDMSIHVKYTRPGKNDYTDGNTDGNTDKNNNNNNNSMYSSKQSIITKTTKTLILTNAIYNCMILASDFKVNKKTKKPTAEMIERGRVVEGLVINARGFKERFAEEGGEMKGIEGDLNEVLLSVMEVVCIIVCNDSLTLLASKLQTTISLLVAVTNTINDTEVYANRLKPYIFDKTYLSQISKSIIKYLIPLVSVIAAANRTVFKKRKDSESATQIRLLNEGLVGFFDVILSGLGDVIDDGSADGDVEVLQVLEVTKKMSSMNEDENGTDVIVKGDEEDEGIKQVIVELIKNTRTVRERISSICVSLKGNLESSGAGGGV